MKTLLLIDAYAMIYRAYYAFIRAPRINSRGENTSAIYGFLLTLDDLIKFKKGVSKMSETLKNEILENHFVWVQVVFDKDGIIS